MSRLDELFAQCLAAPDSDASRMVWADAVGGERGELVVLQCRLASGAVSDRDEWRALRARERELIAANGVAWSGLADEQPCWFVYRRGFIDALEFVCSHDERLDPILAAVPLARSLANSFVAQEDWDLARQRANPRSGDLAALRVGSLTADSAIEYLVERGARLRALSVENCSRVGARLLADSGLLANVERLSLGVVEDGARIIAAAPRLRALHAGGPLETYSTAIPPTVVELGCRTDDIATVARLAVAPTLQRLRVETQALEWDAEVLGALGKLRSLDLSRAKPDPRYRTFALDRAAALPALRELSLGTSFDSRSLETVARAYGPQLDTLHWSGPIPRDIKPQALRVPPVAGDLAIASHVAGEFLVGLMPAWSRRPLEYGDDVGGPWFEGGVVR